jgi:hypothetical protein
MSAVPVRLAKRGLASPRWAMSGLGMIVVALAGCATALGYNVDRAQENRVTVGMTSDQVMALLGHPTRNMKYRNQPGATYTYRVLGQEFPPMLFDVDFDADGKVSNKSERMDMDRGGGGRDGMGGGGLR